MYFVGGVLYTCVPTASVCVCMDYFLGKYLLCAAGKETRNTRLPVNELKRRGNAYICTAYSGPVQVHTNGVPMCVGC